jgi:hypothetical protein
MGIADTECQYRHVQQLTNYLSRSSTARRLLLGIGMPTAYGTVLKVLTTLVRRSQLSVLGLSIQVVSIVMASILQKSLSRQASSTAHGTLIGLQSYVKLSTSGKRCVCKLITGQIFLSCSIMVRATINSAPQSLIIGHSLRGQAHRGLYRVRKDRER